MACLLDFLHAVSFPHSVLDCLEQDHDFLLAGNVFTPDLLHSYIEIKREEAAKLIRTLFLKVTFLKS